MRFFVGKWAKQPADGGTPLFVRTSPLNQLFDKLGLLTQRK